MSSCPYEERGEPCQCYGRNDHIPALELETEDPIKIIKTGPFKNRIYVKINGQWKRDKAREVQFREEVKIKE
jgi:hypothetical protein